MMLGSESMFRLLWPLLLPIRLYIRYFPWLRGKGMLIRNLVLPVLPREPALMSATVPGGLKVSLRYRETLGWSTLLFGPFECHEMQYVANYLRSGDTVLDVGANVGLYTVAMAGAVGNEGKVIAVEPMPENLAMMWRNLKANQLNTVQAFACAVGDADGQAQLHLANDSAYPSLLEVEEHRGTGRSLTVRLRRLDDIWTECGQPKVRFIKLDVEGAELSALKGAPGLLRTSRPAMLLEANSVEAQRALQKFFTQIDYTLTQPPGFLPHNFWAQP
jgi:FkbM family methyltransferase